MSQVQSQARKFPYPSRFEVTGQPGRMGCKYPLSGYEARRYCASATHEYLLTVDQFGSARVCIRPIGHRAYEQAMFIGHFHNLSLEELMVKAVDAANKAVCL